MLCQAGLHCEAYYRHLAHLSDRLGSLEVAISLIPKINYRPGSGPDYFGHSFDPQPLLLKYRRRTTGQSISARNFTAFPGKVSSIKSRDENVTRLM